MEIDEEGRKITYNTRILFSRKYNWNGTDWDALAANQWVWEGGIIQIRMPNKLDTLYTRDLFDISSNWLKHSEYTAPTLASIPAGCAGISADCPFMHL